ncbi:MAG TPA: AMP-binding protein [Acidimicrobiales bacterium]
MKGEAVAEEELEGIARHGRERPDAPALILGEEVRTFGHLDDRTNRLAHVLRDRGAEPGTTVAVVLPNGFEFFETALATSRLGVGFLHVNWHLKVEELTWILGDSAASVVVTDEAHADLVRGAAGAAASVLVAGTEYESELERHRGAVVLPSAPSWSPVFYTSGTTGRPKGVIQGPFTPARAGASQDGQRRLWSWEPDDVYIVSGPAYHAGPGGWAMTAFYVGATTVILPTWDAREWLRLVERHRVTRSFMVPAHFIRILEVPEAERGARHLSSLRLIVHGAAPCPVDVKRRIMEALAPAQIWELYGMSEGGATRISPEEWLRKPGSVGTPWPGVEVRILDEHGVEQKPGVDGLIYVLPPGGARFRYHGDPDKTAAAWRDEGFTVGDVGHLDEDGYLYVTDRAADMVIRGGVNIYPREVEDALHRHPAVVDCAVFGVPDARHGEHLVAVVETRQPLSADALMDHCRSILADFKCPEQMEVVDTLPRDPAGKVLKRRLKEQYA